jgi:hypothetical protein
MQFKFKLSTVLSALIALAVGIVLGMYTSSDDSSQNNAAPGITASAVPSTASTTPASTPTTAAPKPTKTTPAGPVHAVPVPTDRISLKTDMLDFYPGINTAHEDAANYMPSKFMCANDDYATVNYLAETDFYGAHIKYSDPDISAPMNKQDHAILTFKGDLSYLGQHAVTIIVKPFYHEAKNDPVREPKIVRFTPGMLSNGIYFKKSLFIEDGYLSEFDICTN